MSKNLKQIMEEEDDMEAYTMDKELIIEAWVKYRPSSQEGTPRDGSSPRKKDINEIYGDNFMNRLMAGIKQKKYKGKKGENTTDDKIKQHLTHLLVKGRGKDD